MKKTFLKIALTSIIASGIAMAGKDVIVVETPVQPVQPTYIDALPWYIGAGLVWSGAERDCCTGTEKDTAYGYVLRAGYDFNEFVGVEARYMKADQHSDVQINEHYGLYLKPQYHITDAINVYGLLGYGQTKFTCGQNNEDNPQKQLDKDGFNWGLGMELDISADRADGVYARGFDGQGDQETSWGLWVDYQNLLSDEGKRNTNVNVVTAGVTYDF